MAAQIRSKTVIKIKTGTNESADFSIPKGTPLKNVIKHLSSFLDKDPAEGKSSEDKESS